MGTAQDLHVANANSTPPAADGLWLEKGCGCLRFEIDPERFAPASPNCTVCEHHSGFHHLGTDTDRSYGMRRRQNLFNYSFSNAKVGAATGALTIEAFNPATSSPSSIRSSTAQSPAAESRVKRASPTTVSDGESENFELTPANVYEQALLDKALLNRPGAAEDETEDTQADRQQAKAIIVTQSPIQPADSPFQSPPVLNRTLEERQTVEIPDTTAASASQPKVSDDLSSPINGSERNNTEDLPTPTVEQMRAVIKSLKQAKDVKDASHESFELEESTQTVDDTNAVAQYMEKKPVNYEHLECLTSLESSKLSSQSKIHNQNACFKCQSPDHSAQGCPMLLYNPTVINPRDGEANRVSTEQPSIYLNTSDLRENGLMSRLTAKPNTQATHIANDDTPLVQVWVPKDRKILSHENDDGPAQHVPWWMEESSESSEHWHEDQQDQLPWENETLSTSRSGTSAEKEQANDRPVTPEADIVDKLGRDCFSEGVSSHKSCYDSQLDWNIQSTDSRDGGHQEILEEKTWRRESAASPSTARNPSPLKKLRINSKDAIARPIESGSNATNTISVIDNILESPRLTSLYAPKPRSEHSPNNSRSGGVWGQGSHATRIRADRRKRAKERAESEDNLIGGVAASKIFMQPPGAIHTRRPKTKTINNQLEAPLIEF